MAAPPLAPLSLEGEQRFHVGEDFRVTVPAGFRKLEAKETKRATHRKALKDGALILVPDEKGACCKGSYPAIVVTRAKGGTPPPSAETCERAFGGANVRSLEHVEWSEVRELPGCRSRVVHRTSKRPTTGFLFGGPRKGWTIQCDDGPKHDLAKACEEVARSFLVLGMGRVERPGFATVRPMGFREGDPARAGLDPAKVVALLVEWPLEEGVSQYGAIHFRGIGLPATADMTSHAACKRLFGGAGADGSATFEAVRWKHGDACRMSADVDSGFSGRLVYTVLRPTKNLAGERKVAFQVNCMMRGSDAAARRACSQVLEGLDPQLVED